MNEDALRLLVREAVARHLDRTDHDRLPLVPAATAGAHCSHARFVLPAGSDGDGACLIEPTVRCNHCGYCQSYGH
jgi:hypothetical protein